MADIWTPQEVTMMTSLRERGVSNRVIAERVGKSEDAVKCRAYRMRRDDEPRDRTLKIEESPYPVYNDPLVMEGDALVLSDIEAPFHTTDFFNRCLDLADVWGIRQCIVAGDLLHFDSLSAWEANWVSDVSISGLSDDDEKELLMFANDLPEEQREKFIDLVVKIGDAKQDGAPNVSQEMRSARKVVKVISELFDGVDMILGNHDSRMLRALSSPMFPTEILRLVEAGDKWRIRPYYYSRLISDGETFQVEHPKSFAKNSAVKLASKYQCHILHAHSHRWGVDTDISGRFYAIHMGCIVDENRLPYAAQRHHSGDAHKLGSVIVRGGYPYLLGQDTPWDMFKKMR